MSPQVPWSRGQDYPPGNMSPGGLKTTYRRALQGQENRVEGCKIQEGLTVLGGKTELRAWPASLLCPPMNSCPEAQHTWYLVSSPPGWLNPKKGQGWLSPPGACESRSALPWQEGPGTVQGRPQAFIMRVGKRGEQVPRRQDGPRGPSHDSPWPPGSRTPPLGPCPGLSCSGSRGRRW